MPARGKGPWQQDFLRQVKAAYANHGESGCAWYLLAGLRGRAKEYEGRYLDSARSLVRTGELIEIQTAGKSGRARGFIPAT